MVDIELHTDSTTCRCCKYSALWRRVWLECMWRVPTNKNTTDASEPSSTVWTACLAGMLLLVPTVFCCSIRQDISHANFNAFCIDRLNCIYCWFSEGLRARWTFLKPRMFLACRLCNVKHCVLPLHVQCIWSGAAGDGRSVHTYTRFAHRCTVYVGLAQACQAEA